MNYAQRRLTQLTGLGLLERFRPFRLEGCSHPYHYALAHTGALIIAATRGEQPPRRAASTNRLHRIATSRNFDHRLGVNQFFIDLAAYERLRPGSRLHHWWPDSRLNRFFSPPGTIAYGLVKADALGVWTEHEQTVAWYLEHDTGSEALSVLVDLLLRYCNRTDAKVDLEYAAHQLKRALKGPNIRRSVSSKQRVDQKWALEDRLSEDQVQAIVEDRQAGESRLNTAKKYGISESSVKRIMRRHRAAGREAETGAKPSG